MKAILFIATVVVFSSAGYFFFIREASSPSAPVKVSNLPIIFHFEDYKTAKEAEDVFNSLFPAGTDVKKLQVFLAEAGAHGAVSAEEKDPLFGLRSDEERARIPMHYNYVEIRNQENQRRWYIKVYHKNGKVLNILLTKHDESLESRKRREK